MIVPGGTNETAGRKLNWRRIDFTCRWIDNPAGDAEKAAHAHSIDAETPCRTLATLFWRELESPEERQHRYAE